MRNLYINPLLIADQYKLSHRHQLEEGTTLIYSNTTPRESQVEGVDKVVVFGMQYFIKAYLMERFEEDFFALPEGDVVSSFERVCDNSLGKGVINSDHVRDLHQLGYLPLKIKCLPEGTLCPIGYPLCTIYNTHPDFAWLTNFIETICQNVMWRMITSATDMRQLRLLGEEFWDKTVGHTDGLDFQFHTFAMRGNDGLESACMCDAGHLLSFRGSDTIPTIPFLERYYGADSNKELISASVPATEHSIMCSYGDKNELETFRMLIEDLYPSGIVSIVSDTWDLTEIINPDNGYLVQLKDKVLARDGKVVIRPDSSDKTPLEVICGDEYPDSKYNHRQRPVIEKGVLVCLDEIFGHTINVRGLKEINAKIGCIYGESINLALARKIFEQMRSMGYAANNIVFGIGSLEHMKGKSRDTYGLACKATYCEVNGEGRNIFKDPITDSGMKKSHVGLMCMEMSKEYPGWNLSQECSWEKEDKGFLYTVFEDGKLVKEYDLEDIRRNLRWENTFEYIERKNKTQSLVLA